MSQRIFLSAIFTQVQGLKAKSSAAVHKYGPMAFEILYCVASGLAGEFLAVCNCNSVAEVEGVMKLTVTR